MSILTYSDMFERELRKLATEELERLHQNAGHGMGVPDYASYMKLVGEIAGIRKILEFCDEARSIVNKMR